MPGTKSAREDPMNAKVNLDQQFKRFHDHWHPRIVATVNDYDIKLVKVQGEFVWHQHHDTDELFLVVDGRLRIQLQDHDDIVSVRRAVGGARGGCATPPPPTRTRVPLLELAGPSTPRRRVGTPSASGSADRPTGSARRGGASHHCQPKASGPARW